MFDNSHILLCLEDIVTHMTIARQRLGKDIPEVTLSIIEVHPLLGNEPINTLL
jgi:hypothetical protein